MLVIVLVVHSLAKETYEKGGLVRVSRFGVFCRVMTEGSFTRAANALGYTQSAVSQTVKGLERELGTTLVDRGKDGLHLTRDGEQFFPYIQGIYAAELELAKKSREMQGLESAVINIGTFTSVSRNMLPPLMHRFREEYPNVRFVLRQGEYLSISEWLREGTIDIGFIDVERKIPGIETRPLMKDEILAVLPKGHPLASKEIVSLKDLVDESFILLDEGDSSAVQFAFAERGLRPQIDYVVSDDYSILSMVEQGLGVSALYKLLLEDITSDVVVKPIEGAPKRQLALAFRDASTLSLAARAFSAMIVDEVYNQKNVIPVTDREELSDFTKGITSAKRLAQLEAEASILGESGMLE